MTKRSMTKRSMMKRSMMKRGSGSALVALAWVGAGAAACHKRPTSEQRREQSQAELRAARLRRARVRGWSKPGPMRPATPGAPVARGAATGPGTPPRSPGTPPRDAGTPPRDAGSRTAAAGLHQENNGYGFRLPGFPPEPMAPLLAMGPSDPARSRCRRDDDCVLSRYLDGECCPVHCGRGSAISVAFESRLRAHLKAHCAGRRCPIVDCAPPRPNTQWRARCRKGSCVAVQETFGTPGASQGRPSANRIRAMMNAVLPRLRRCLSRARVTTRVRLRVRLSGKTGRAERLTVLRKNAAPEKAPDTPLSRCLLAALRRGRVPGFRTAFMNFVYPIAPKRPHGK